MPQEAITGDNIRYGIGALSADGTRIAFYRMHEFGEYSLWLKDLNSGDVRPIPLPGDMANINLFMSNDGRKLAVGKKDGPPDAVRYSWEICDLNSDHCQVTPLIRLQAWDPSGRYLAGATEGAHVIYDSETSSVLDVGLPFTLDTSVLSVEWR